MYSYFTTLFVSLGVFLFGYDQGVMSGIITYPCPSPPPPPDGDSPKKIHGGY